MDLGEVWEFEWSGGTPPPQVLLQFWQNVENSFLAQNFLKRPIFLKSGMYADVLKLICTLLNRYLIFLNKF